MRDACLSCEAQQKVLDLVPEMPEETRPSAFDGVAFKRTTPMDEEIGASSALRVPVNPCVTSPSRKVTVTNAGGRCRTVYVKQSTAESHRGVTIVKAINRNSASQVNACRTLKRDTDLHSERRRTTLSLRTSEAVQKVTAQVP
ncbi:hypothetical protein BIW11_02137 [Tropilaelaps mercedesae]|uniref:Uncharacterized protein n=1 Tax=Tropilaelaps mercedesae TaxID=418985 RepID=A0A1V9X2F0_9ACAR|nr:hypothetical protein BIW11_02137 [Tropilaelaps mercedesae]